jgi:uncharacterized caspase-like protein
MRKFLPALSVWLVACFALAIGPRPSAAAEMRFALAIGNSQYRNASLPTPANDAGLVADALQAAGFTVTGARDLNQATLRESFREFIDQVAAAGPDAVALVYLAGYGVQFAGNNYFVPVDADIQRDVDVPLQAIRISDFVQPLASLPGRVKIVILDAARQNGFGRGDQPLAGGLALIDPPPGLAMAFNAAPGTVGPDEQGPYGAYATALTEMIGTGGLSLDDIFARVRLRVSEQTQGAEVPWYASQIDGPFFFTERMADAPPPPNVLPVADIRHRHMRDFGGPDDAYAAAVALDTIDGYEQFLADYPDSPYSQRVAAMLAVRREEVAWRHCVMNDTPPAYWSYLRRYPNGPHVWDARRRLAMLRAEMEPPPSFVMIDFGVPPPPPDELVYVDRPVVIFAGPRFRPPPPPVFFLPPRPREFAVLPPPPPPRERYALPTPTTVNINVFVKPPPTVVVQAPAQGAQGAQGGPGAANGRPTVHVSLPAAVTRASQGGPGAPGTPGTRPGFGAPQPTTAPGTPPAGGAPASPPANAPAKPPTQAFEKPATPPPHPTGPNPALETPGAPPPHAIQPTPTLEKPAPLPPHTGPNSAFEKPATPPPHPTQPTPAFEKPAPPPHPTGPAGSPSALEKPATPPPHPTPTFEKPAPLPPPPPHPSAPAQVMQKPAPPPPPPPPHQSGPAPAASKPSPPPPPPPQKPNGGCPAGKTATPQGCK